MKTRNRDLKTGRFLDGLNKKEVKLLRRIINKRKDSEVAKKLNIAVGSLSHFRSKYGLAPRHMIYRFPIVKKLDVAKKNYIAGFVDGEGHMSLRKYRDNRLSGPRIYMTNTNKGVLDFLKRIIGVGAIHLNDGKSRLLHNSKPVYNYMITDYSNCESLLKKIYPYLIIKKQIAKLMLRYISIRKKRLTRRGKLGRITKVDSLPKEMEIHNQISFLNKRGIKE